MINDWTWKRKLTVVIFVFIVTTAISASFSNAQEIPMIGNCTDSDTLVLYQNIETSDGWENITTDPFHCPYGCIENASQYGDDCKLSQIEKEDAGWGFIAVIGISIIAFLMFYLALKIENDRHEPIKVLFMFIGLFLLVVDLEFIRRTLENVGQDIMAGQVATIYGVFLTLMIFVVAYFIIMFFRDVLTKSNEMATSAATKERKRKGL